MTEGGNRANTDEQWEGAQAAIVRISSAQMVLIQFFLFVRLEKWSLVRIGITRRKLRQQGDQQALTIQIPATDNIEATQPVVVVVLYSFSFI